MGIFRKTDGRFISTNLASVFLALYADNKADSWRWLVARSLWRFVVPNGTSCKVNGPAQTQNTNFAFFHLLIQLLTHLSAHSGNTRYLYFEELCKILADDANWKLGGKELYDLLLTTRLTGTSGFNSPRSFLADLENSLTEKSEFDIPRDNFNGLFLKAFEQTGFFQFRHVANGKTVALALNPELDFVLQRRLRFILDHPPTWNGTDWPGYLDIQSEDLPKEVTKEKVEDPSDASTDWEELKRLLALAVDQFAAAKLIAQDSHILRLVSCLMSKRFLILTGLAGSGKTKLAQALGRWMTPTRQSPDVFSPGTKLPSERTTYFIKRADNLSVEFWNSEDEAEATKVTLPREMITEWADYIRKNSDKTAAREIREAVKTASKFSDQLHSFETHLKAAAFTLLASSTVTSPTQCCEIVPVGADWTGNENILGYPDGLQPTHYVAKPALDLILHATEHRDTPHFLILDEMNLSHVERYFADILSLIESDEGLELYAGDIEKPETWRQTAASKRVPPKLKQLPQNLFIIGTVNVDETTYMFSPKVLDRANVIEFRMDADELAGFLANPTKPDLAQLDGKGSSFGKAFVDAAKSQVAVPADAKADYDAEMLLFFKTLQGHGAEFGYRTAYETARFVHFYKLLGNHPDDDTAWFRNAFDCVVVQKFLPKLHGSRAKLGPVLKKLWFLCVNDAAGRGTNALMVAEAAARSTDKQAEPSIDIPEGAPYPLSAEKIGRMWRLLLENGFASFAEA
jgi:energy-coupling factor transporter ATP-binding protein EcfA2